MLTCTRSRVPAALACAALAMIVAYTLDPEVSIIGMLLWSLAAALIVAVLDRVRDRRRTLHQ